MGTKTENKEKLSAFRVIGYASGDFANNFSWALVSGYLLYFWTDVALIPAALCGTFMLLSKGIDAVSDWQTGQSLSGEDTAPGLYLQRFLC